MSVLALSNEAHNTNKNAVYGFIRQIEESLATHMIPTDIYNLCMVYYVLVEQLMVFGNDMELSTSNKMVTKFEVGWTTVYGDIAICQQLYPFSLFEWTIQIMGFDKTNKISVAIGIEEGKQNRNCFIGYSHKYKNKKYYCLQLDQYAKLESNNVNNYLDNDKYGLCEPGDIIQMLLNTQTRNISFYYNGTPIEDEWNDIDLTREYYFAICLYEANTCAQLIDFSHGIS